MRTSSWLLSICMLLVSAFAAAAPPEPKNSPGTNSLPPPPGMNDPGVSAGALPPGVSVGNAAPAGQNGAPLAEMNDQDAAADADPLAPVAKPDMRLVRDKSTRDNAATNERIAASEVTTRKQGDDTVEEYRQNGHVWMIRIVQPNGPTQTFMDPGGTGKLYRDPQQGPVAPVYFSLYEWN